MLCILYKKQYLCTQINFFQDNMQRLLLIIICLSVITLQNASAQSRQLKKDLSQARTLIKNGKELDKAIKLMTDQLANSEEARITEKVYLTWYEAVEKQYAQGNEQLYLKQQYDTAKLFSYAKEMFRILEALDSVAAQKVDKEGEKVEYRSKHAQILNAYRPNLFYGGSYFLGKDDYKTAFDFFSTYLDCAYQPLFKEEYDYIKNDTLMPKAAYYATHCGYKLGDAEKILKYSDIAQRDNVHRLPLAQYKAEAYRELGDTISYIATLRRGFRQFTRNPYFFIYLQDWYTKNNMPDEALQLCNDALKHDSNWQLVLLAKSNILLNLENNNECIAVCDKFISLNDTIPDVYFYAGTAYLNEALKLEKEPDARRKNKAALQAIYKKALPYMEKYRQLSPDDKNKWAPALYRIYLNLNMGKQFEEMDKIVNKL